MKIDVALRTVRSIAALHNYISDIPEAFRTIETLKYGRLYWVYLGTDNDNIFITIDFSDVKPRVNLTERYTDNGDEQNKYYLGRSIDLNLTSRGKQEFFEAVFNKVL